MKSGSFSQPETPLLRQEPFSSLCRLLSDARQSGGWNERQVASLARHLEDAKSFFDTSLPTAEIPETYLETFKILCASFSIYASETKQQLAALDTRNKALKADLEAAKSENGRLSIQQNDIASLNIELGLEKEKSALLQKQVEAKGDEAKKQTLRGLAQMLKIRRDVQNEEELLGEIANQKEAVRVAICQEIAGALGMPRETGCEDIVANIRAMVKAKAKSNKKLKAELAETKSELATAEEAISEARAKFKSSKPKLARVDELEVQNRELLMKVKEQGKALARMREKMADEKSRLVPVPSVMQDEVTNMKESLEHLSRQYERQAVELRNAMDNRSALVVTTQKLLDANSQLEKVCGERPANDVLDGRWVMDVMSGLNIPEVESLCRGNDNFEYRLGEVVQIVNHEFEKMEGIRGRIEAMKSAIYGQLKFLNMLVSSRDLVTSVVLEESSVDDAITCLKSQIARTHAFLEQHAIGYFDEPSIFEGLLKKGGTADLMELLQAYLSKYGQPTTPEGQDIFVMFCQAVSANDILRKFADCTQQRCVRQAEEVQTMREYSVQLQKSCETQCRTAAQETEEKVEGIVNAVRSILRESVLDGNITQPILDSLETLNDVVQIDDREYVASLQKQNANMQSQLAEMSDEKALLLKQAKADLQRVQKRFEQLKAESDQKIVEQNEEFSHLEAQLESKNKLLDEMKESSSRLQGQNEQLSKDLIAANEKYAQLEKKMRGMVDEFQVQFNLTKADYEKLLETTRQSEVNESNVDLVKLQESYRRIRREKRKLKAVVKQQLAEKENLEARLAKSQADLERIGQGKEKVVQHAQELSTKFEDAYAMSKKLIGERRSLERKVKQAEAKQERAIALMESQTKVKLLELEGDMQTKVQNTKNEYNSIIQTFLVDICKKFSTYVNVEQPITIENVGLILQQVKNDVESVPALRRMEELVSDVKEILQLNSNGEIEDELKALLHERAQMLHQLEQSEQAKSYIFQLESWIERMFSVCSGGLGQSDELPVMQKRIEELIYNAVGEGNRNEVELLRTQKQILTSPSIHAVHMPRRHRSLRHVIVAISFALRVQKSAGHMESVLGLPSRQTSPKVEPATPQLPVFSQFIFTD